MNEPIVWKESFSVGIQVIDEQHQHLIEIINALSSDLETRTGDIDVTQFFNEVVNYGDYHFQTEENYFSRYNYPERQEHLSAHQAYKDTLAGFLIAEGDSRVQAEKLLTFLQKWWVDHITNMDQTLRDLTKQNETS